MSELAVNSKTNRRGATMIEITVAMVVLLVFVVSVTKTLIAVQSQSRHNHRRLVAIQEAANVMERVFATPWDQLASDRFAELEASASAQTQLPNASVDIVIGEAREPAGKHITVTIAWTSTNAGQRESTQLVAWRFQTKEAL